MKVIWQLRCDSALIAILLSTIGFYQLISPWSKQTWSDALITSAACVCGHVLIGIHGHNSLTGRDPLVKIPARNLWEETHQTKFPALRLRLATNVRVWVRIRVIVRFRVRVANQVNATLNPMQLEMQCRGFRLGGGEVCANRVVAAPFYCVSMCLHLPQFMRPLNSHRWNVFRAVSCWYVCAVFVARRRSKTRPGCFKWRCRTDQFYVYEMSRVRWNCMPFRLLCGIVAFCRPVCLP
jgi:hypothetical protein